MTVLEIVRFEDDEKSGLSLCFVAAETEEEACKKLSIDYAKFLADNSSFKVSKTKLKFRSGPVEVANRQELCENIWDWESDD